MHFSSLPTEPITPDPSLQRSEASVNEKNQKKNESEPNDSSSIRSILRNALSILLGDAMAQILVGIAIAIAAKKLGPNGFGSLKEAQAFIEPFLGLAAFGLPQIALTFAASRKGCDGTLRGTVLWLHLVLVIGLSISALVFALCTHRTPMIPLLTVLILGALVAPISTASRMPFYFERTMHKMLFVPFLASIVQLGATYATAYQWNHVLGYQLAIAASLLVTAGLQLWVMQRYYPARLTFDFSLARSLVRVAWPSAIIAGIVITYSRGSYFFLRQSGKLAQGEYGVADTLIVPVLAIAGAVLISSLPTIATHAANGNYIELRRMYIRSIVRLLVGLIPMIGLAWFFAGWILHKYAPEYSGAVTPFRILLIGAGFMFLNQLSSTFITALQRLHLIMWVALVNLIVYLILASQLVPRYSSIGAAFATTIMESINSMIQVSIVFLLLRRKAPIV